MQKYLTAKKYVQVLRNAVGIRENNCYKTECLLPGKY